MLDLPLHRGGTRPLYLQIADCLARMIDLGSLAGGVKLPSSRTLAKDLAVSRLTAQAALDELIARGLVTARSGSGHYVTSRSGLTPCHSGGLLRLDWDRPEGDLAPSGLLSRGGNIFDDPSAFALSPLEGFDELRSLCAARCAARGAAVSASDLLVNGGGRQGLGAGFGALREAGVRTCWCPPLCWEGVAAAARADGLALRRREVGDVKGLGPADVLYLNPTFSNPTGSSLTADCRQVLADASEKQGFWIVEDDAYGDLRWGPTPPALRAYSERVIYLASLSQTFCPGLRIGWLAVPRPLARSIRAQTAGRFGPLSSPLQLWAARFLSSPFFEKALDQVQREGRSRMTALRRGLGIHAPQDPGGGIYVWLSTHTDGRHFADGARQCGLAVAAGERFGDGGPVKGVRLSISSLDRGTLEECGRTLARLVEAQ